MGPSKQSNTSQKSQADDNILHHQQEEKQLTQDTNETNASDEAKVEYSGDNVLEKLLQDDQYYPVQENHMDFIPITKFNDDYAEFLLVLQNRIANPLPEDNMVEIAELIHDTGCWDVQNDELIFDLGLIQKTIIKKIAKSLNLIPQ